MNSELLKIGIIELSKIESISARTLNICEDNDLNNLEKILQYFVKNKSFKGLRNCGDKSNQELINICIKYKHLISKSIEYNNENFLLEAELLRIFDNLSNIHKEILNNLVSIKFKLLSNRSKDYLRLYLNNDITIVTLMESMFHNLYFNILTKNLGGKTGKEITSFINEIKEQIKKVSSIENEADLNEQLLKTVLFKYFSIDEKTINKICNNVDFTKGIPLFRTIYVLIENGYIFNNRERFIFKQTLEFYSNTKADTLDKVGAKFGITRERARQLRNLILNNFNRYFLFVNAFDKERINLYDLDESLPLLNLDDSFVTFMSNNESVDFSIFFITRIISILFSDNFILIGNRNRGLVKQNNSLYKWKSIYLISKKIFLEFDFENLVNDVSSRRSNKTIRHHSINFKLYLQKFKKTNCTKSLDLISDVAKQILYTEFKISVKDDYFSPKERSKTILDFIYDALNEANKPIKLSELQNILNKQHPGISKNIDTLRANCRRDPRIIYFGRSSLYGLKKWEQEFDNIKGGTMRDISEEFLLQFDTPVHIDKITEFVRKYRNDISVRRLYNNLKLEKKDRFVFFQNRYVGLAKKNYDKRLYLPYKTISWEEKFNWLLHFSEKNGRLPSWKGDKYEKKLYRFFITQLRLINKLENSKKNKIITLAKKFNYQKGKKKTLK